MSALLPFHGMKDGSAATTAKPDPRRKARGALSANDDARNTARAAGFAEAAATRRRDRITGAAFAAHVRLNNLLA